MSRLSCSLLLMLLWIRSPAQTISLKDLEESPPARYIGVYSQNDILGIILSDDKYFTNGIHAEVAHPVFDNAFSRNFLLKGKGEYKSEYALSFGQDMYTPEDISNPHVDSSDRPYCGLLYFTYTRHANNAGTGRKTISSLYLGVQGPAAGAGSFQTIIHTSTESSLPEGWDHQVRNGLLLDYEYTHQRIIPLTTKYFELNANATAHIGTVYNFIQAGLMAKIGLFNYSYYQFNGIFNPKSKKGVYQTDDLRWSAGSRAAKPGKARYRPSFINRDLQLYFFISPAAGYMLYDGTVQGSLVPFEKSPYTFSYDDYEHINGSLTYGFTLNYRSVLLQYEKVSKRDVFKGTGYYGWGAIRMIISIK